MSKQTIGIDPGHFASTPGKCSPDKTVLEYKWNFEMGRRFKDLLVANNYDARLTITEAESEEKNKKDLLTVRANRANDMCKTRGAANTMFVSIHINAAGADGKWKNARGWSVFVYGKNGNALCSKASKDLADSVFDSVQKAGFTMRQPMPNQKWWLGNYTVLQKTNCKAILMENFFMDNKEDVKLLLDENVKRKLLLAWYAGIMKYMGEPEKPSVLTWR